MLEIIWRLRADVLADEAELRTLIAAVVALPGVEAAQYDLNRKGQWRPYELTHTVVDALTQRTQLLVIRGPGDREDPTAAQVMIALGKHGEQPTVIAQVPDEPGVASKVLDGWADLYEALALESTFLISGARRATMAEAGLDAPAIAGAVALAWHPARAPTGLRSLDPAQFVNTPIAVKRTAVYWRVDLGEKTFSADDIAPKTPYRAALSRLGARLLEG